MVEHRPVVKQPLVDGQSATPWSEGRQRLETPEPERIYWLATVSPDGRPLACPGSPGWKRCSQPRSGRPVGAFRRTRCAS